MRLDEFLRNALFAMLDAKVDAKVDATPFVTYYTADLTTQPNDDQMLQLKYEIEVRREKVVMYGYYNVPVKRKPVKRTLKKRSK